MKTIEGIYANRGTGERMNAFRMNPNAFTNLKQTIAGLYNLPGGGADKKFELDNKYHHVFVAAQEGVREDPEMVSTLLKKYKVYEEKEEFSLMDLVGHVIPDTDGVVNCSYGATREGRVEPYYVRRPDPELKAFKPIFSGVSTVASRKEKKAGVVAGGASSSSSSSGGGGSGEEDDGSDSSESEDEGDGGVLLKENESSAIAIRFASRGVISGQGWKPDMEQQVRLDPAAAVQFDPEYDQRDVAGRNHIVMDTSEAWDLMLPNENFGKLLFKDGLVNLKNSPPVPFPVSTDSNSRYGTALENFAQEFGGSDPPERMQFQCTTGHLLDCLLTEVDGLVPLSLLADQLRLRFNPDLLVVHRHRLALGCAMAVPQRPPNSHRLFCVHQKEAIQQGDTSVKVTQKQLNTLWKEHKVEKGGSGGVFDDEAEEMRTRHIAVQESFLVEYHAGTTLPLSDGPSLEAAKRWVDTVKKRGSGGGGGGGGRGRGKGRGRGRGGCGGRGKEHGRGSGQAREGAHTQDVAAAATEREDEVSTGDSVHKPMSDYFGNSQNCFCETSAATWAGIVQAASEARVAAQLASTSARGNTTAVAKKRLDKVSCL